MSIVKTRKNVLQKANVYKIPQNRPNKNIRTFEEYVNEEQTNLLKHVQESPNSPLRETMLKYKSPLPVEPHIRRVARPKVSWVHIEYERIWTNNREGRVYFRNTDKKNAATRFMAQFIQNRSI